MISTQTVNLVVLAEDIYKNQISSQKAYLELKKYDQADGRAAELVHFLYHYIADADIRANNVKYRATQKKWLYDAIISLKPE